MWVDSEAALGTMHRRGNGKLRHVRVGSLWIQERIEEGDFSAHKIAGSDNPSNLCTKYLASAKIVSFMNALDFEFRDGRALQGLEL